MSEFHRKMIITKCLDCCIEISHRPSSSKLRCKKCSIVFSKRNNVEIQCSYCGQTFNRQISKTKYSKHDVQFCNRKCKEKAQSLSGNCPHIRPSHYGRSNGRHIWKRLLNETSNCVDCKSPKKYTFQVHHKDSDRENNNLENLEVVCSNCHNKRHLKLDKNNQWIYDNKYLTPRDMLDKL